MAFSSSTLTSALSDFGVFIQKGIAQFGTLVADQFVAATNSAGTSSAGTVTILAGNTVAQVTNSYVLPTSKIFVTLTASTTGSWYISDKESGSFKLTLSQAQNNDVSFDYFIVQTEGQIATSTPEVNTVATSSDQIILPTDISSENSSTSSSDTTTSSSTPTQTASSTPVSTNTTPPVVTLNGAAAMQINQGDTFTDPGATATDSVDGDLTAKIVETGSVNSATAGLYTLTYSATDSAGNVGNVSRVVTVIAAPAPVVQDDSTSSPSSDSGSSAAPSTTASTTTP
jgi:hypothetical protein